MPTGLKHLITCRCVLPQFKRYENPPQHQFVVFSVLGDDDIVQPKFVQCNNCGIIHKVIEVNRSEIVAGREDMRSITSIDDIKMSMSLNLIALLEQNSADLPTWEAVQYAIINEQWGGFVVLTTDEEDGLRQGKYIRILGQNMFKVETFTREEVVR
jgi:hypothetical protein